MNKIIAKLLEVSYPGIDTTVLMEIVGVTPNPELAAEMLCGLYEEQTVKHQKVKGSSSEGILTFLRYDKWTDRVHYSYQREETKNAYFPKSVSQEELTLENFDSLKCPWKDGVTHSLHIKTGNMENRESYMSFLSWEKLPFVTEVESANS
jgi:hypothetical protein